MLLPVESEADMRSCYCAAAITFILTDGRRDSDLLSSVGFDEQKLKNFVLSSQNYAGGFGDPYNCESHAGLTYCAVACLKLLGDSYIDQRVTEFCVMRQQDSLGGFQGRCNKLCDSCYSFWNMATLQILMGKELCLINE
jgi:prenyltransferase beta subunit